LLPMLQHALGSPDLLLLAVLLVVAVLAGLVN
jgi:hypothetical protein